MTDTIPAPETVPVEAPRLLTLREAAAETGLSVKAIARRCERGSVRYVHEEQGNEKSRRMIPRAELERLGLIGQGNGGTPRGETPVNGGELVVPWRAEFERERLERKAAEAQAQELREQLLLVAHAGPIRAFRLRRELRSRLT